MKPTIGRIVHYTLTAQDADAINRRRTTGISIAERIGAGVKSENGVLGSLWPIGAQAHIGNAVEEGDAFPLVITRVWGDQPTSAFNGQLMLDGNDTFWVTSTAIEETPRPGAANWPTRD